MTHLYHSFNGWYTLFMEELTHNEGLFPAGDLVRRDVISVGYINGDSIDLQFVDEVQPFSYENDEGQVHSEHLLMADKSLLGPVVHLAEDEDSKYGLIGFGESLEPIPDVMGSAQLRSRLHGLGLRFLEIVQSIDREPLELETVLANEERVAVFKHAQRLTRELSHSDLWLRLEAKSGADSHLIGKIIVARLAMFVVEVNGQPIIQPWIYSFDSSEIASVPEQLELVDPWLYVQLITDPELLADF
jgi:hypothetical protein